VTNERASQVWMGPLLPVESETHVYLLLWESERHEEYIVFNLTTGKMDDLMLKGIDEDTNWERLA
jgi:hypothetical protein